MSTRIWVVLALALGAFVPACRGERTDKTPEPPETSHSSAAETAAPGRVTLSPESLQLAALRVGVAERRVLADEIRATAAIRPNEQRLARVSPQVPGKATEVLVVLGDHVEPAQTMAILDSLEMGEKKSAFLQARTNFEVARRNYEREATLFRQRVSSEKDYLGTKGDFERSEAAYRAAREALRLLGVADEDIDATAWSKKGQRLSSFPLRAPFSGTVVEQHITLGELIAPTDAPYTIADLRTVWVLVDIYEKDLARVALGADVQLAVDAYPGETFRGAVDYISNLLDPNTRAAQARVVIPNADGRLRPGMFATASITTPETSGTAVTAVPQGAVLQYGDSPAVFVEERLGTYVLRSVTVGKTSGPDIEVRTGLERGERVVTDGTFTLKSMLLKEQIGESD